jgi:hypothetical protein
MLSAAVLCSGAVHFVTVAGLGGEPDYEQRFTALAKEVDKLVTGSAGENKVYTLSGADATKVKRSQTIRSCCC